ncbi:hypothetical protein HDU98_010205 [Podochytrium sp. JEL0797]|nr:hypothetical protein HDU98_010205 [Podochytrium sp. JEL0797]
MATTFETTINQAQAIAEKGYKVVEPYVPTQIKENIVSPTLTYASGVKTSLLADGVLPTVQSVVSDATILAQNTATTAKTMAFESAQSYRNYAVGTATWAITGATTTITAYTPGPVQKLLKETLENAQAVRRDPVGVLKPYVPAFVVHTSERTFEIVTENIEQTKEQVNATTGYIVSRVNGSIEYVTSIPQVHSVIEQLNAIAAPVLEKIKMGGKSEVSAAEAEAEVLAQ